MNQVPNFPSIMSDEELGDAIAARRQEIYDPFRRQEKPDPWPLIERRFPRIAATIRELWGKRALDEYFNKLVVDERGDRVGFPPDVLDAILEIARLHAERFELNDPLGPWEDEARHAKWWYKP